MKKLQAPLDPFQLGKVIERKIEGIYEMANRRLSPQTMQKKQEHSGRKTEMSRRPGCGKDAREASLEIAPRFPLSHSQDDELRLHPKCLDGLCQSNILKWLDTGTFPFSAGTVYRKNWDLGEFAPFALLLVLRVVIAKDFAGIDWQNLVNFGILPLIFEAPADFDRLAASDQLRLANLLPEFRQGRRSIIQHDGANGDVFAAHNFSARQVNVLLPGD